MKKTILFLMNGFGIEQAGSHNIYSAKLMPNLDRYTRDYLFSSIETSAFNLTEGYRLFSTGSALPLTYSLIEQFGEKFATNPNLNFFLENVKGEGKIQLFLFVESDQSLEHLKNFINFIRTKWNNPIFLHLIMTSLNDNSYKDIERIINRVTYDYKDCKIATVVGENVLKAMNISTYMNMLQNEVGEKWREITKKFSSLISLKTAPKDVKEFYMNEGFKIEANDSFFFFNYEMTDMTNLISNISKLVTQDKYFSMFSIKGIQYPMFAYPSSGISMATSLNKIGAKALILSNEKNMPLINYYCQGLQNIATENISFSKIDESLLLDDDYMKAIIHDSEFNLTIINYQVDEAKDITGLTEKLATLDKILGNIHDFCLEKKYSLFISSLYGIKKELPIDNFIKAAVNFSTKVPVIIVDPVFNKSGFRIDLGNIYNLSQTVYTNINTKYEGGAVIIKKKSPLLKLIKK